MIIQTYRARWEWSCPVSIYDNLNDAIAWRDALESAFTSSAGGGAQTVSHGGRTVVYHSLSELQQQLNRAQDLVNKHTRQAAGQPGRVGFSLVEF